jgi:nitrous oxide reductase accessory protein NosL
MPSPFRARRLRSLALVPATALALALGGCTAQEPVASGPPAIEIGASCAHCGMRVQDLAFASERRLDGEWLAYDSIECLIADQAKRPGGEAYLPDHGTQALHAAASMWVVRGNIASPMGGGYAAFADRAAADSAAAAAEGTVDRLEAFAAGAGGEAGDGHDHGDGGGH